MRDKPMLWIGLAVILLVFCCCCVAVAGLLLTRSIQWGSTWQWGSLWRWGGSGVEVTEQFSRNLVVSEPVDLSVDVPIGDITVRPGAAGKVDIQATKRAWGSNRDQAQRILENIAISVDQVGSRVTITVSGLSGTTGVPKSPQVDLVVTVPRETSLNVESRVGRVRVTGTQGDLAIRADVGDVELRDVVPLERLETRTRVANIEFSGALAARATYTLTSDVGRIAVRLPGDSAFKIEAQSDVGNVRMDFPVSGRSTREGFVGKEVRGDVGVNPTASLYLRSRIGEISVLPR